MPIGKYHNQQYGTLGGSNLPLRTGDRRWSQDRVLDFRYQQDLVGLGISDLIVIPAVFSGGVVTQGGGANLNITAGYGYAKFEVDIPDSFASIPPTVTQEDLEAIRIAWGAQTNINASDPNCSVYTVVDDGATPNYVKMRYLETDGNTRNRAKYTGSYAYEIIPEFDLIVDGNAPTDYDIHLATFTSSGGTYTFTFNATILVEPNINLSKLAVGTTAVKGTDGVAHIANGTNADTNWLANAPLIVESNDHGYINIRTPNNRDGGVLFSDPDANYRGLIGYGHATDYMYFYTAAAEAMRLDSNGYLGIGITPSYPLSVSKSIADYISYQYNTNAGGSGLWLRVASSSSSEYLIYGQTASLNPAFAVRADGRVGIGTTPTDILKVQGAAQNLYAGSFYNTHADSSGIFIRTASSALPQYLIYARSGSLNPAFFVDAAGEFWVKNNIQNDGYLKSGLGRWPTGHLEGTYTSNELFDTLAPYLPNTNDEMILSGAYCTGGDNYILTRAKRYDATHIYVSYINHAGAVGDAPFTDGESGISYTLNITW